MTRHCSWIGLAALVVTLATHGSAQTNRPSFEVTSVRKQAAFVPPSPPTERPPVSGASAVAAAFNRSNATLVSLVRFAYGVRDPEVLGGPGWIRSDLFEINARAADGVPVDRMRLMVQSLLEERFKLVVRRDQREMRGSALVVARNDGRLGPRLETCEDPGAPLPPSAPVRVPSNAYPFSARCAAMSVLADAASSVMNVPVVDRTGLDGLWSYSFFYASPEPLPPGPARDRADAENTPQFAAALQEYLGLKLESTNGPFDVLVIESVQQPDEN